MSDYDDPRRNVVDAEVIKDVPGAPRGDRGTFFNGGFAGSSRCGSRRVTYFSMMGPSAPGHQQMPLAGFITLVLILSCLFHWGFLAALGFVFFYMIASGIGIWYNLQTVLKGGIPNPWLSRVLAWGASLLLVSLLV